MYDPPEKDVRAPIVAALIAKIRELHRDLMRHSSAAEKKVGLKTSELLFMQVVGVAPGSRLNFVAQKLSVNQGTSSNIMRTLVQRSYIKKQPDPDDGRGVLLYLTKEGAELISKSQQGVNSPLREAVYAMPVEQLKLLDELLGVVVNLKREREQKFPSDYPER